MRHIKLFENFNEAKQRTAVEAAQTSKGTVVFSYGEKFVGRLSFKEVYKDHVDEKRDEEVKALMLKTFPSSDYWKTECEKYETTKVQGLREEVLLAAAKERSSGKDEGQIQLWDESKLTHSISMGGPFSDQVNRISGKYVGGMFFAQDLPKTEVKKIMKEFNDNFKGRDKTKKWIVSN